MHKSPNIKLVVLHLYHTKKKQNGQHILHIFSRRSAQVHARRHKNDPPLLSFVRCASLLKGEIVWYVPCLVGLNLKGLDWLNRATSSSRTR
jgi:hypothetical protein